MALFSSMRLPDNAAMQSSVLTAGDQLDAAVANSGNNTMLAAAPTHLHLRCAAKRINEEGYAKSLSSMPSTACPVWLEDCEDVYARQTSLLQLPAGICSMVKGVSACTGARSQRDRAAQNAVPNSTRGGVSISMHRQRLPVLQVQAGTRLLAEECAAEGANLEKAAVGPEKARRAADLLVNAVKGLQLQMEQAASKLQQQESRL